MNNLKCKGTEKTLGDCVFNGWENNNCTHSRDIGVICSKSTLKV